MAYTDISQGSSRRLCQAVSSGYVAFGALSADQQARVVGKTSRGIFIQSTSKWITFISCEPFRSPVTITIDGCCGFLQGINREKPVRISLRRLIFPDAGLIISTQNSAVYRSPLPALPPLPDAERQTRLYLTARQIMDSKKDAGLAPMLPFLLKFSEPNYRSTQVLSPFHANMICLYEELRSSARPNATQFLTGLLGNGGGLTPSGDDFAIGFLLALNRWREILFPGHDLEELNRIVVESAYKKTTTLSANLIECASQGQGDERLIAALDWLMSGTSPNGGEIDELLGWGSSSGGDVFAGFAAALSLRPEPTSCKK